MTIFSVIICFSFSLAIFLIIVTNRIRTKQEEQEKMQRRYLRKKMDEEDIE